MADDARRRHAVDHGARAVRQHRAGGPVSAPSHLGLRFRRTFDHADLQGRGRRHRADEPDAGGRGARLADGPGQRLLDEERRPAAPVGRGRRGRAAALQPGEAAPGRRQTGAGGAGLQHRRGGLLRGGVPRAGMRGHRLDGRWFAWCRRVRHHGHRRTGGGFRLLLRLRPAADAPCAVQRHGVRRAAVVRGAHGVRIRRLHGLFVQNQIRQQAHLQAPRGSRASATPRPASPSAKPG